MSSIAALPLIVSQFPTAMPEGKALGDMEQKTWGDLRDMLSVRREGQKDGPNLVFARFKPETKQSHGQSSKQIVRRLKINVEARTAIALDIDGNKETGEVAPPLRGISERITTLGWAALLYTSHSHSARVPRYRIVLPLNAEIPPHLPAVEAVAEALGLSGVLDKSKLGASSVFYLPSAEPGKGAAHHTGEIEGQPIDAEWITDRAGDILAKRDRAQAEIRAAALTESERRRAAKQKAGFKPTEKLIEAIRDRLDLAGELLRHGYVQQGDRFLFSGSETGIPGVHVLRGSDGVERAFSHHSGDPLAAGNLPTWCSVKAVDAVDVVAILDFGGDFTKALHELATRFGIGEPLKAKAVPEEPPGFSDIPPANNDDHSSMETRHERATRQDNETSANVQERLILNPGAPLNSARELLHRKYTQGGLRCLHHLCGEFYEYRETHYQEAAHEEVRSSAYQFLDAAFRMDGEALKPFNPTKTKVGNVLEALAAEAQLPGGVAPPAWLGAARRHHPAEYIACKNGLLHLPTRSLAPHTPELFNLNALDFPYDLKAPAPRCWINFLNALWNDDHEAIGTLQEMFGLLLTGDTRHQKAFLIVGPKRSGKGTIARILTRLIGQANVCGPTLSSLAQNFGLAPLIGKRLAVVSDARLGGKVDQQVIVERVLAITGEDSLTVDRKFREGWTGRLETRFLILTNELPKLADASGALASRFIVLTLARSFFGEEDLGLTERLVCELPGILNWALEGWARLQGRGHFHPPASSRQAQEELEDLGSPIGAFLRERCIMNVGAQVSCDALYTLWLDWCRDQNRDHVGNVQDFGRNIRTAVPGVRVAQLRIDGFRTRCYEGVRVKTNDEHELERTGP